MKTLIILILCALCLAACGSTADLYKADAVCMTCSHTKKDHMDCKMCRQDSCTCSNCMNGKCDVSACHADSCQCQEFAP